MMPEAQGHGILARAGQSRVLITGMPRSGTTWLGRILALSPGAAMIREPFNRFFGVPPIGHMFPMSAGYDAVADRFFLDRMWGRALLRSRSTLELRELAGQKAAYWRAVLRPPRTLIIKDPSASFLTEHLVKNLGFRTVFLLRHPFALHDSFKRVGWDIGVTSHDLERQAPDIFAEWGGAAGADQARQLGMTWSVVNAFGLALAKRYPERVRLVWHEDLCRSPQAEIDSLLEFLDMPSSPALRRYVTTTTSGTMVRPPPGTVHDFVRDSTQLPERWRQSLTESDRSAIAATTRDVMAALRPDAAYLPDG